MSKHNTEIVFAENKAVFAAYASSTETTFAEVKMPKSTVSVIKDTSSLPYAIWGDDNLRPKELYEYIEGNDLIPSIINFKTEAFYADGLVYGIEELDETTGRKIFKELQIPEIEEWLEMVSIERYLIKAGHDYYSLKNAFAELITEASGKIVNLNCIDNTMCRLSKQDKAGKIKEVYVNANWDNGGNAENSEKVIAIDPEFNMAGQILPAKNHIIPLRIPKKGRVYYDKADWEALIDNGWLEIAKMIPLFKKKLMENQISIKYHVQIPDYHWKWKFPNWDALKPEEMVAKRQEEVTNFTNFMKGVNNAGNVFFSSYKYDDRLAKEYPGWKITVMPIPKGGEYIEDSQETDFHTIRAFGVDPTIVGIGPGKGHQSGSGSDKRVAFNHYMLTTAASHDLLLSPLKVAARVNKWNESYAKDGKVIKWMTKNYFIATLDMVNNEKRN